MPAITGTWWPSWWVLQRHLELNSVEHWGSWRSAGFTTAKAAAAGAAITGQRSVMGCSAVTAVDYSSSWLGSLPHFDQSCFSFEHSSAQCYCSSSPAVATATAEVAIELIAIATATVSAAAPVTIAASRISTVIASTAGLPCCLSARDSTGCAGEV